MHRLDPEVHPGCLLDGEPRPQVGRERVHFTLRRRECRIVLQASDDAKEHVVARSSREVDGQRRPDVRYSLHVDARWIEQLESGLEHTNDFEGLIAETEDLADHAGVGAKAPLPELVAQDGARRVLGRRWTVCLHTIGLGRRRRTVGIDEIGTHRHAGPEHAEQVRCGAASRHRLGIGLAWRHKHLATGDQCREARKLRRRRPQIVKVGSGPGKSSTLRARRSLAT